MLFTPTVGFFFIAILNAMNKLKNSQNAAGLENQLAAAQAEKAEAQEFVNRARTYLMLCTRQVQDIKAEMHYGKEVRHA